MDEQKEQGQTDKKEDNGSGVGVKPLAIVVVLIVVVAGYFLLDKLGLSSPSEEGTQEPTATPVVTATPTPNEDQQSEVKVFNISGKPFEFSMDEIKVKKGDAVKIVFTNEQGNHDWTIDEFDARTPIIGAGETAEVEFVADETGTFEFYCSVGNHRQLGMKGNLIVE